MVPGVAGSVVVGRGVGCPVMETIWKPVGAARRGRLPGAARRRCYSVLLPELEGSLGGNRGVERGSVLPRPGERQERAKDEELAEMLPSGKQQKFKNRVRWAATYLKNAGALERTNLGVEGSRRAAGISYRTTQCRRGDRRRSRGRLESRTLRHAPGS